MSRLKQRELCPLHKRRDCCDRGPVREVTHVLKYVTIGPGVKLYPDGREACTKAALKRRKDWLIRVSPVCAACGMKFTDYSQIELSHRSGKGIGGGKHNDEMRNLTLMHARANREQGSMPLDIYLATKWKPEHCL